MLRITITGAEETIVTVEGRLSGPWVEELDRCWTGLVAARGAGPIRVRLDGLTFADAAGKGLLRTMHVQGAALEGSECMTRAIVEEIVGACSTSAPSADSAPVRGRGSTTRPGSRSKT